MAAVGSSEEGSGLTEGEGMSYPSELPGERKGAQLLNDLCSVKKNQF